MVGFGTALAGFGAAQPQIQAMDAIQMKKNQDTALAKVLQQYAASRQNGQPSQGAPPAMPPTMSSPGATPPVPGIPAGAPRPPGMPPAQPTQAPPIAPPPPQGGGQGNFAGSMPDLNTMITMLAKSGLPADQQFEALKSYGAFASPFEKTMSQLEMKQMQIANASTLTSERLKMMETIAGMNINGRKNVADTNNQNRKDIADNNNTFKEDPEQKRLEKEYIKAEDNLRKVSGNKNASDSEKKMAQDKVFIAKRKYDNATKASGGGSDAGAAPNNTANDPMGILGD